MSILTDNLEVSFQALEQDLTKRGKSRYLQQFRESSVMQQIVEQISLETQELYDEIINTLRGRTIHEAVGVQLDKLGYLVGQSRVVSNSKLEDYFTPFLATTQDKEEFAVDVAPAWVRNGRLFGDAELPDSLYKKLILAKIYKNQIRAASLPQVRLVGVNIYGHLLTLIKTGLQEYSLGFLSVSSQPGESAVDENSLAAIYLLRATWSTTDVDNFYALPIPSVVLLDTDNIIIFPKDSETELANAFTPDTDPNGKTDMALVAIKINIGGIL